MKKEEQCVVFLRRENHQELNENLRELAGLLARELGTETLSITTNRDRRKVDSSAERPGIPPDVPIYSWQNIRALGLVAFGAEIAMSLGGAFRWAFSSKSRLLEFVSCGKVHGVRVGDIVFDSIIRHDLSFLHPRREGLKFFMWILRARITIRWFHKFSSNRQVRAVCVTSLSSLEAGVLARVSLASGTPVYVAGLRLVRRFDSLRDLCRGFYWVSDEEVDNLAEVDGWERKVEEYLETRTSSNKDPVPTTMPGNQDVEKAFRAKRLVSLDTFFYQFIDPDFPPAPPIVVSLHCFSDMPHHAGNLLFLDFYSAFTETMEMIAENDRVRWIVKPHPSRGRYGEESLVEDFLQKKNYRNVSLWPDKVSMLSALNWARGFVTVNGTIGIEAACFGKPVLLAGSSYYGHLGFNIVPLNKDEYRQQILQAHDWPPLSKEQKEKARKALHRYHNLGGTRRAHNAIDRKAESSPFLPVARGDVRKAWLK